MSDDIKQPTNGSSLLEARLQRMRQGPVVSRTRPGPPQTTSHQGRMSLRSGELGAGGLGIRSSILDRSAKDRISTGPWNPFAEEKKVSYGSSGIFRGHGPTSSARKYTPEAPQIGQVGVSSDLLQVRELLKGRGYASASADDQPSQPVTTSSRRESLMKRQPALATAYSSFGLVADEGSVLGEERQFTRPSVLSSLSTNGHVNGSSSFLSGRHSPISSPILPTSPTFPAFSTYQTSPTFVTSPTFPTPTRESLVEDSDSVDLPILQKRQEIESQFEALGGSMDTETAGALDRISRVRKFLEESKRASEARLSVSSKDKYQINKYTESGEEPLTKISGDDENCVTTGDSFQQTAVNRFPSQLVESPSDSVQRDSDIFSRGLDNFSDTSQQDDIRSRFQLRSDEPRESFMRDIPQFSSFPPRYVPMKQEVNHSENSLFRPIEADGFSRPIQNRLGTAEKEIPVSQKESQNIQYSSNTVPRTKPARSVAASSTKDSSDTKSPRNSSSSLLRPTKSTAAKAMPETKPKPTKNVKKSGKKLPQIAMFENMGQQNKLTEKTLKKGPRGKTVDATRDKTVQKMLFGKTSAGNGDHVDSSDVISEDARSQDSAELVSISQSKGDTVSTKDGQEKGSKPCVPSPRSKTPKPSRDSPHSKPGRTSQSSRSSSSDKSGQFSPGTRRKSLADSPNKSRSRRNSPERQRRKSVSEQQSNNIPLVRRNSIRASDQGMKIEDKCTVSSRNKMVDKARSRSKPDLRDLSSSREDKSPSKPAFRRSKSVGKQECNDSATVEPKQNANRKTSITTTKDFKANQVQNSRESKQSGSSGGNNRSKISPSKQKTDIVQRAVAKLNSSGSATHYATERTKNSTEIEQTVSERVASKKPVGGWEFIYVGSKERKSDDIKRFVDLSREIRGVELEPEDPDTIPVGPGVIRKVLDQYKRPSIEEQNSAGSETSANMPPGSKEAPVNGDNEVYSSKTSDLLERVAQLRQGIKVNHKVALDAFEEDPAMSEMSNRQKVLSRNRDEGEVSEMGGAPVYGLPASKLNFNEFPGKNKLADMSEDSWPTARSMDSESTDYDSAVEAQTESSTAQFVLAVEEDSMSEYNSAAETLGSEAEENEAYGNKSSEHPVDVNADNHYDILAITPKAEEKSDCNLIAFDDEATTPVPPTVVQPVLSASNNVDHLLFDFDPVRVIADHAPTTSTSGFFPVQLGDDIHKENHATDVSEIINLTQPSGNANDCMAVETGALSSSLADLADLVINVEDVKGESQTEGEIRSDSMLYTQMQGYDNLGFGSEEENEQDITMTDEIANFVSVSGSVSGNVNNFADALQSTVEGNTDYLNDKAVAVDSTDISKDEDIAPGNHMANTSESVSSVEVSKHPVIHSEIVPGLCSSKPLLISSSSVDNVTNFSPVISSEISNGEDKAELLPSPFSEVTGLPNNSSVAVAPLEQTVDMYSDSHYFVERHNSEENNISSGYEKEESSDLPDNSSLMLKNDSAFDEPNTTDSLQLITGEVIFQPSAATIKTPSQTESAVGKVFQTPSDIPSKVHKERVCSTETEGGSSDGERERFHSESDGTEGSELKSSSLGSSSATVNEQQGAQVQGSGRKKRHRSESKKRRKRKHIEKAAAMKEAVTTSQTQSEPSSPQQLNKFGPGRRKTKGAMLVTNLLVLDMGLSAPEPDFCGQEPSAVFLPLKSAMSESEESIFDDAGSIADDESESNFGEVQNAEDNMSMDTDDQPYLTPEAVSPECEIPEPGFVKNNVFVRQDKSCASQSEIPTNDEPAIERDTTICAMFKRTLGLLTRRQTELIAKDVSKQLPAEDSIALMPQSPADHKTLLVPKTEPVMEHSLKEEIGPTIKLMKDKSRNCGENIREPSSWNQISQTEPSSWNQLSQTQPSSWNQISQPENSSWNQISQTDGNCSNIGSQSIDLQEGRVNKEHKTVVCPEIHDGSAREIYDNAEQLNASQPGLSDEKALHAHDQAVERDPLSPKLLRDHTQSFIFHNKFIQDDFMMKGTHPSRSEGKILGRRRNRSSSAAHTNTTLPSFPGDDILCQPLPLLDTEDRLTSNNHSRSFFHEQGENFASRKPRSSRRFVKDNLFFANDPVHKKNVKSEKIETNQIQNVIARVYKEEEKSIGGSFGKVLRASFRKLTHNKSFRRSKPKSATSTQDLSSNEVEVQSQTGSMLSSLGNSTPCLIAESYAASYTGPTGTADVATESTASYTSDGVPVEDEHDLVQERIHLTSWDPTPLLKELYTVRLMDETTEDLSHRFISMEGVMEKLPMGKRKSTLLKTWKRRYFKAADGWLHYYENNNYEKPCHSFQLMGGSIEVLDARILGIDDGRGHYLMVRCPSPHDFENWRVSLESQTTDNVKAVHVRPVLNSPPNPKKKVVIIDIGSTSVRAGILGKEASLPQVFFPTVVAEKTSTGEYIVGFDAYRPDIRNQSTLYFPIRPSVKVDKGKSLPFNIDMRMMPCIFDKIFSDLKVDSKSYWVLLSTPQMLADKLKAEIMDVLIRRCGVQGVCIAPQALLAMYSYKATSGIIVDVGERIDILPISDGYIVEGGMTRQPFGGEKVADSLKQFLTREHYHFFSEVERLIVRLVMEKTLHVAHDINEETKQFRQMPERFSATVSLRNFALPEGTYTEVIHGESCFKSAEGFFDTNLWGTDYPNLHKLVHKAIIECPMDNRREMCRSIFLSGGVTMMPGFAERLEMEITKLVPPGLTVQVHASPQRYHASFIGGCTLASQDLFQQNCITREDWIKNGVKELKRWQIPS